MRAAASWNGPGRIHGIDLARGLAVLGMLAAHLLWIDPFDWTRPATWIDVANGRSSILFATLAGVSIALVTGGSTPLRAERLRRARVTLAVRAGLIWAIGVALVFTGVPVFVILPAYGILFLLALPLLTLSAPVLWAVAVAVALVVPWFVPMLNALPIWSSALGSEASTLVGWHYPFPLWIAFVAAGLAIGRSRLRSAAVAVRLLVGGGAVAMVAYGLDAVAAERLSPVQDGSLVAQVWTADAHSSGILEAFGSGGFAVAVIGLCLLLCRTPLTWLVLPVRAVGTMPLTAYAGQLVVWAIWAAVVLGDTGDLAGFRDLDPFVPFAIGTVLLCTAWALLVGRGPVERFVAAVTGAVVGSGRR